MKNNIIELSDFLKTKKVKIFFDYEVTHKALDDLSCRVGIIMIFGNAKNISMPVLKRLQEISKKCTLYIIPYEEAENALNIIIKVIDDTLDKIKRENE